MQEGFSDGLAGKESICNAGDKGYAGFCKSKTTGQLKKSNTSPVF